MDATCASGAVASDSLVVLAGQVQPAGLAANSISAGAGAPLEGALASALDGNSIADFKGLMEKLSKCSNLAECGVWLAWGLQRKFLSLSGPIAGPSQAADRKSRSSGLFPLPVTFPVFGGDNWPSLADLQSREVAVECWLGVAITAINALYGCPQDGTLRKPGKVHAAAFRVLKNRIDRFLEGEVPTDLSFEKICLELKERRISYTGEEIAQPVALSVEQIVKGLPPVGHGGSVPVLDWLKGRTRFLMENPLECVLPEEEWGSSSLQVTSEGSYPERGGAETFRAPSRAWGYRMGPGGNCLCYSPGAHSKRTFWSC